MAVSSDTDNERMDVLARQLRGVSSGLYPLSLGRLYICVCHAGRLEQHVERDGPKTRSYTR